MRRINIFVFPLLFATLTACSQGDVKSTKVPHAPTVGSFPAAKPDCYWKKILSPEAYDIMVGKGTERPFKNPYHDNHRKGIYVSAATGKPLFASSAKFDSGTGWPTFFEPIDEKAIMIVKDTSFGTVRDEVIERSTGLHLGHVFDDGPAPTGKRYCMNFYALKFIPSRQ